MLSLYNVSRFIQHWVGINASYWIQRYWILPSHVRKHSADSIINFCRMVNCDKRSVRAMRQQCGTQDDKASDLVLYHGGYNERHRAHSKKQYLGIYNISVSLFYRHCFGWYIFGTGN